MHYISLGVLFFIGLYLQIHFIFARNLLNGLVLLNVGIFSLFIIIPVWKWFAKNFAPWIIEMVNDNIIGRKIIAGGSFSYFEYKDDEEEIGIGAPFARFISLLIAFLGLSTTLIKIGSSLNPNITLSNPVENPNSVAVWSFLLVLVPLLLTPIIPIIWSMEDLRIKAWDMKKGVNWRVADKYKVKFNSVIAVGAVTAGLSLTGSETSSFLDNAILFATLIGYGVTLLVLPLSLMTIAYYLQFRGTVKDKVKKRINLPTILTELIYDVDKYRSMEGELERTTKQLEKYKKKVEYQKKGGLLGKIGIIKPKTENPEAENAGETEQTLSEETDEEDTGDDEQSQENKFISHDKITEDYYSEMEEKYFGESSGRSIKKKQKKSSPTNVIKGTVDGVSNFVGSIFRKKEKDEEK